MPLARLAPLAMLLSVACVPTMELREGPDRDRLVDVVRQFCAAERSPDPHDTRPLLTASLADLVERAPSGAGGTRPILTSADPAAGCEPGRTWYLGGSRMFAEVRLAGHSDRLDFWRGDFPRIGNIIYGRSRQVAGRKVKNLRAALMAQGPAEAKAPVPPPLPVADACDDGPYHFAFLATDTRVFRQGATVKIVPTVDISPAGTRELALTCVGDWSVTGPASLSEDRRSFTIAPDAPVGSVVRVSFSHKGKQAAGEYRVIGRDEVVLTGRYSQTGVSGCEVEDVVRELEFAPGGRFSVTFYPLESYRDYWGSYTFDPATGRISLVAEDGNFVPPSLDLEGRAELAAGKLILKDLFLGSRGRTTWKDCTYTF